jgi:glycosyltransferase 2 family protein
MSRLAVARGSRRGSLLLATLFTLGFAYLAVRDVDVGRVGVSLRESNYWWLLPAAAMLGVAFFLRVLRWQFLFSARTRPSLWPATQALLVGQFFNNVLPLRAGDAARVLALHSLARRSRAETTGTVLIERVLDVLALLLVFFAALPWLPEVGWLRAAGVLALALVLALVLAIVVLRIYGDRPLRFVLRPVGRLRFVSAKRVEAAIGNLMLGLIALRSLSLGFFALLLTILSWMLLGVSFWFVMLGFDLGVSPAAGLLTIVASGLSLIIPSAPAAVGVFEGAVILALAAYGIPQSRALSFALVVHALNVLPFVGAGLIVLNLKRRVLVFPQGGNDSHRPVARRRGPHERPPGAGRAGPLRRPRDDEDDVPEPADRDLHVGELRQPP